MDQYDAIVIGAGAAGMMCALRAGQRARRVLLLDRAENVGAKILISGGGRCNFTNIGVAPDRYISENPHFCISALKGFSPRDFIAMVKTHNIAYHEKTLGQLFCDGSAQAIIDMLASECRAAGVEMVLGCEVSDVARDADGRFTLRYGARAASCASLVLATGGLSIPKMGASGFAHNIAKTFALPVVAPRPGLVPLTFDGEALSFMRALSGLSLPVEVRCGKRAFREAMIFTHRGLSGPAILQISSYWHEGETIEVNLLPDADAAAFLRERKRARPKAEAKTILAEVLPTRLAQAVASAYLPDGPIGVMTDKLLNDAGVAINGWTLKPAGTEGYAKAEVTIGGVDTRALSSKTMEAKNVPGLFVVGEAMDVTGWLGGYNFHWAWASGWAAGNAI